MVEENLVARVEEEADGNVFVVRSPSVGFASELPARGVYLNPQQEFLVLRVLGRQRVVELPRHAHGHVAERFVDGLHVPVEYGQPLLRLEVHMEGPETAERAVAESGIKGAGGEDLVPVPSPSDGIFYRRPTPDSPPYVDVGDPVQKGTVLGLVEVMKSFNQIVYGGPGLPPKGTVVEIRAQDTSEVQFGAPLFLIRSES